jgi:hypothetical protein
MTIVDTMALFKLSASGSAAIPFIGVTALCALDIVCLHFWGPTWPARLETLHGGAIKWVSLDDCRQCLVFRDQFGKRLAFADYATIAYAVEHGVALVTDCSHVEEIAGHLGVRVIRVNQAPVALAAQ